jgi:hypothetical protein
VRPVIQVRQLTKRYGATAAVDLDGHTCGPGAAACPLPAWAGMSVLAAYAATALLIGGCILAWRDA